MQHWYALHTKPHKERQVETFLATRGMQVFFPSLPVPHRRGRPAVCAFFPRYLFVNADIDQVGLWSLHYTPGTIGVVMFGGVPARVDDRVIAALQQKLARVDLAGSSSQAIVDDAGEIIEPGDRVAVKTGPLAEFQAVFDRRLSAAGRVRVLIYLLQRWTAVELEAGALEKSRGLPRRDLVSVPRNRL